MINLWLLVAKFGFLGLLYTFVIWVFVVIIREKAKSDIQALPGYKIRLVSDKADPKEYILSGVVSIGRSRDNEVWLSDDTISNHHARISFSEGFWVLEDLESKNGTYVNREKLHGNHKLSAGDSIKIGRNELEIIEE